MLHQITAGALYEFLGYLTTRDDVLPIGASADAAPFPVLLKEWAETRGLILKDAEVADWRDLLNQQVLPLTEDSGDYVFCSGLVGHVARDGQDPKWGGPQQDVWPRELRLTRISEGAEPVIVDYVHAESTARAALALMVEMKRVGEVMRRPRPAADDLATLNQEFSAELTRVRELMEVYRGLGDPGTFALTMVGDVVRRAEEAQAAGSASSIRHMLGELRGCQ